MTGYFLRAKRGEEYQSVEIEFLTDDEFQRIFAQKDKKQLIQWIDALRKWIRDNVQEAPERG